MKKMINPGKHLIKNPFGPPLPDYVEVDVSEVKHITTDESRPSDEYEVIYKITEPGLNGGGFIKGTIKDIKDDKGFWEVV